MRRIWSAVLYTALVFGANTAVADIGAAEAAREGSMKKLIFTSNPEPAPEIAFTDPDGAVLNVTDLQGQYVLLNFWATWCAPCRKEMPALNALQLELGGDDFRVVTVATGRNSLTGIRKFFEETGVTELPLYLDPKSELARGMGVLGLPITVILDPDGNEIARLRGDAEWDGASAKAVVRALIGKAEG